MNLRWFGTAYSAPASGCLFALCEAETELRLFRRWGPIRKNSDITVKLAELETLEKRLSAREAKAGDLQVARALYVAVRRVKHRIMFRNPAVDFVPALLADGRVVYSRWEYSDKDQNRVQSL